MNILLTIAFAVAIVALTGLPFIARTREAAWLAIIPSLIIVIGVRWAARSNSHLSWQSDNSLVNYITVAALCVGMVVARFKPLSSAGKDD